MKTKTSIVKVNNKDIIIKSGDILWISMGSSNAIFKARFIDLKRKNIANAFILDPDHNMIDIEVKIDNIIKIEKPNWSDKNIGVNDFIEYDI